MAGGQSSALITVSKAKGWDPTVIPARGDQPAHSIANFDKDQHQDPMGHKTTGELPEGTPDTFPQAKAPDVSPGIDWEYPAHSDGNAPARRTNGANPFPGGGF
jgi:hypothetical protein